MKKPEKEERQIKNIKRKRKKNKLIVKISVTNYFLQKIKPVTLY